MRLLLLTFLLLALPLHAADPLPRALWIWDATTLTDPVKRDAAFALGQRHGITTLFLATGSIFAPDAPSRVPVTAAQLAQFNLAARALGIAVHALDGDPSHALTTNHNRVLTGFSLAINFNATQPTVARLSGFQ